jgi:hypothetical protein
MASTSPPRKRIITCQGTIQLVTALAVMAYRDQVEGKNDDTYENYLVIYSLNVPPEQLNDFIASIKRIATTLCGWQSIIFITDEQMGALNQQRYYQPTSASFKLIFDLIGTAITDEIYLCRNWQFGNQLLINAYQSAEKICYGDSIGVYFSANSPAVFATYNATNLTLFAKIAYYGWRAPKRKLKQWRYQLETWLGFGTVLKLIEFDRGYFSLPNVMGEVPTMPYKRIEATYLLAVIHALVDLIDTDYIQQLQAQIGTAAVAILLSSNFSEAKRMSFENELSAYTEFLGDAKLDSQTILLIKPHPRDSLQKMEQLQQRLVPLFAQVILLDAPELFFLPFEIFFLRAFLASQGQPITPIKVFAVSSACLSLKLLFNLPSSVGFGEKVTTKFFYDTYVEGRLAHERELKAAIAEIDTAASSPT